MCLSYVWWETSGACIGWVTFTILIILNNHGNHFITFWALLKLGSLIFFTIFEEVPKTFITWMFFFLVILGSSFL